MKAFFSNRMVELDEPCLTLDNRGLQYGDGLFETMIYQNNKIKYFDRHLDRLHRGIEALGMIPDANLINSVIEEQVKNLIRINKLSGTIRIKLQVWRKSGGLFTPLNNKTEFFITVQEQQSKLIKKKEAEISLEIKIQYSPFSRFKTCNMLPYVLAGLEKKKRKVDELVLLNEQGFVAECTAANIFWVKNGIYYTPGLESGCIEGVKRGVILEELKIQNMPYKEVLEGPESLYNADFAFACNVAGIYSIQKIASIKYKYHVESFLLNL
ncbi:aminodeoxychorismate lyase [soil metagenome]